MSGMILFDAITEAVVVWQNLH